MFVTNMDVVNIPPKREPPVRVAAFTGRRDDPASFFRLRQHFAGLRELGLDLQEFSHPCSRGCRHRGPLKVLPYLPRLRESRRADVTWFTRTFVVGVETIELLLKRPRVMDVDDAIWLDRPPVSRLSARHLAGRMDLVIAGNAYIADWFSRYCPRVEIVPTAIDVERYRPAEKPPVAERFIVGWTGTSSNFPYLDQIEAPLARFVADHPDAMLKIIADQPWRPAAIPPERIIYQPWRRAIEVSGLQEMSVGIMPLADTPWARGKCSFKMLQYMAVGLPVVVSPVGMNVEVLARGVCGLAPASPDEWRQALETLYRRESLRREYGQTGRRVVEEHFSAQKIVRPLAGILRRAAGR